MTARWFALIVLLLTPIAAAQELVQEEIQEQAAPAVEVPADLFARDSFRIDPIVCPFKGEIEYEPGDVECGLLEVPENRENPDSRFIELHYVKLSSRWGKDDDDDDEKEDSNLPPGKRDDPVIYLTGGPGAKVTYYVERLKDHGILDHRDLYILEQRGIGFSGDFCPFYDSRNPAADDVATFEESQRASLKRKSECVASARAAGADLTGYSTIENARDVKALRLALDFEKWNVWGISYGSILGQAYAREDPDGILALAIDAIMPLDIRESDLYWRVINWYNRDLEKLQEICDRQPECSRAYPDIGGRLREAVQSVLDNPIEVDVKDTEVFPSGKARIFQDIVALLPFIFFYEQDNYPGIPGLVYAWADAVEKRDMAIFRALAGAAGGGGFGGISQGMYDAIHCLDGGRDAQAAASKKDLLEHPVLGSALGTEESIEAEMSWCLEMGMPPRPAEEYSAIITSIPALIIEGDMDPITPPPNAKAIMPGFENGTYVEFPYAGHGPSRSVECAGDMLNAFYDNPQADPDLSCVEEMKEPQIWAPMYVTNTVPRLAALFLEDKKAIAVPGAWIGLSVLITLIAFLRLSITPIGRKIDVRRAEPTAGARPLAWLTSAIAVASIATLGAAAFFTSEASEMLLIFGLPPWAKYGAWLGLLAGILGFLTLFATLRARAEISMQIGTLIGFVLTGSAAVGLASFILAWGLSPL